ncbi:MAG: DUF2970 domain-containing protein [Betaproteobacteria bacterium]|nr:MAG: DUF2970 domain-containing protein [Betaproteobacteria bacterium]TAG47460.1 MAG: DUF2970 domain-containing protein [Betaproteobacteria bacterium]
MSIKTQLRVAFTALFAVFCSFVGIRKSKRSLADEGVRPFHIAVAALLSVAAVVSMLIGIVRWVLR